MTTPFITRGRRAFEQAVKAIRREEYGIAADWMITGMNYIERALTAHDRLGPRHRRKRRRANDPKKTDV